jgi:hypothetical protein
MDHVHVAFDSGKPGLGDGPGKARAARLSGVTLAIDAARKAGFSGTDLVNMVAIAGRESSYDPTQHNPVPPDDSWGLWQINVRPEANPKYKSWKLTDPYVNARAARELFKAAGLSPWNHKGGPLGGTDVAAARKAVLAARGKDSTGSTQTSSGGGGGGGGSSTTDTPTTYERQTAAADLGIAEATPGGDEPAGGSPQAYDLADAISVKRKTIGSRIRAVRAALKKKGLRPATRVRLQTELATLLGEHRDLGARGQALRQVAPIETGDAAGDTGAADGGETDAQRSMREAIEANTQAQQAHTDAQIAVADAINQQRQFAERVTSTVSYQTMKVVVDMVSGQLGAQVRQRGFSPGTGVRYAL